MKSLKIMLMTLMMCLFATVGYSQTVNGVEVSSFEGDYIQIVGTSNFIGTKVIIGVDYGQEQKVFRNTSSLVDENGRPVKLNSMVDALNFFVLYGYEFKTAYALTVGNSNVYHFLLSKKNE